MTKDEALEELDSLIIPRDGKQDKLADAFDMAIEALKQEPCDDCISRQAVLDVTWEEPSYTDALNVLTEVRDKVKALPPVNPQKPKSECEHDHEILKAYSDGANAVLDNVRAEIDGLLNDEDSNMYAHGVMDCLEIIDKFMAESEDKE